MSVNEEDNKFWESNRELHESGCLKILQAVISSYLDFTTFLYQPYSKYFYDKQRKQYIAQMKERISNILQDNFWFDNYSIFYGYDTNKLKQGIIERIKENIRNSQ